ncbi:MAG: hypothetical protein ACPHRO_00140 [Nannocystaceae bacterium]
MQRLRWTWWIPGVFAVTWTCATLSANAARDHQGASIRGEPVRQASLVSSTADAWSVQWARPSTSTRLLALKDGRVVAGNAVFDGAAGRYLGYAAPGVIDVLASGTALALDAGGALTRRPIDRVDVPMVEIQKPEGATKVVVAQPSADGSLVFTVEEGPSGALALVVRRSRTLESLTMIAVQGFASGEPLFIRETQDGVILAGARSRGDESKPSGSRWIRVSFGGTLSQIRTTGDLDGVIEDLAVQRSGGVRVALRRGSQLDVVRMEENETLVSMSAADMVGISLSATGEELAVARRRRDGQTDMTLLSMGTSRSGEGVLWRGAVEHPNPSFGFSPEGERFYVNGNGFLCIGAGSSHASEFVGGMPTLFGSWYAVPPSRAVDLAALRRFETFDGKASLEEQRWPRGILAWNNSEDLERWGSTVLSVATGIEPTRVMHETFASEIWTDRDGVRHASMRIPGSMSASGSHEYVVAHDGEAQISVRRLEVAEDVAQVEIERYRARLLTN